MKDKPLPDQQKEKSTKTVEKSSASKKKKAIFEDPKQRKLSFSKVPMIPRLEQPTLISSDSDSDEPLSSLKNSTAVKGDADSGANKVGSPNPVKKSKIVQNDSKFKGSAKTIPMPTLIPMTESEYENSKAKKLASSAKKSSSRKDSSSAKKDNSSASSKVSSAKKSKIAKEKVKNSSSRKIMTNGTSDKHHKVKATIELTSDSDSDLDIPLSKLKDSPKFKSPTTPSKKSKFSDKSSSAKVLKTLSGTERSPKVKISCAKSPKIKAKADLKQRTLFDFGGQNAKGVLVFKDQFGITKSSENSTLQALEAELNVKPKVDWKNLTEEEREKIRLQKREEWNRVRRERNKTKNLKFDDLELTNIPELPAGKPIVMPEGLPSSAFGDIAMLVEFFYTFNKFLAPEETPTITAELLMKALAAGSQGAGVVSKILLVLLRALIGEEEREVNGLGLGLADMPLTVFTVSELVHHYLKFTSIETKKEEETKDDVDDGSSVGSRDDAASPINEMVVPQRIVKLLEKEEFFKLSAADQLKVLMFLFHKIVDSEYFLDYLENLKLEAKELWHQQDAFRKKTAKDKKEEPSKNTENKKEEVQKPQITLEQCSAKATSSKEVSSPDGTNHQSVENAGSTVKEGVNGEEPKNKENVQNNIAVQLDESKEAKEEVKSVKKEDNRKEPGKVDSAEDDNFMKDYPKEPVADLVHTVKQRRIMAAKQAALKEEEERKEKERRKMMDELQQMSKKMQAWRDGLDRCKKSLRLEPLGVDRHFKLYWVFSGGMPGIYVEDGWMYHAGEQRTIDSWEFYDTVEDVEKLMKNLARQGIRESALKTELSSHYKLILNGIKKKNIEDFELKPYDVFEESLKVLKEDMIESGNRIVRGVLGLIANHENWEKQVQEAQTLEDIVPLVLELQQGILHKFLEGAMDQSKGEKIVQRWQENVREVKHLSALHTLFGILENSVKWDKSAENAKCKICRRKAGEEYLVLCDECNRGYHQYCLRPALLDIPIGNWKCPACEPLKSTSRASRSSRKEISMPVDDEPDQVEGSTEEELEESEEEKDENESDSDHESLCHVCGEDGELICCDQCPKVYHLDCHEPPIRRLPRGMWICFICRNPKAFTRSQKKKEKHEKSSKSKSKSARNSGGRGRPKAKRGRKSAHNSEDDNSDAEEQEESESEDDSENEEDDEIIENTRRTRKQRSARARRSAVSTEESEEEEEAPKSRRKSHPKRGSKKIEEAKQKSKTKAKRGRPRSRQKQDEPEDVEMESEEEEEEEEEEGRSSSKRARRKRKAEKVEDDENSAVSHEESPKQSKRKKTDNRYSSDQADMESGRRSSSQRKRNRRQNSEIVACEDILSGMWKDDNSYPFRSPVDPKKVPDYADYVKNPIDLSTIRDKLDMLEYEDAFQFVDDVKLLFTNSKSYNEDNSEVGKAARTLETVFFNLVKENLPGLYSTLCDES